LATAVLNHYVDTTAVDMHVINSFILWHYVERSQWCGATCILGRNWRFVEYQLSFLACCQNAANVHK